MEETMLVTSVEGMSVFNKRRSGKKDSAHDDDAINSSLQALEDALTCFVEATEPPPNGDPAAVAAHDAIVEMLHQSRESLLETIDSFVAFRVAKALNPNNYIVRSPLP